MESVTLPVLHILNKERNAYGLRNSQYDRYITHLGHKIHNLRKVTGLAHGNAKGYKKPQELESFQDVRSVTGAFDSNNKLTDVDVSTEF